MHLVLDWRVKKGGHFGTGRIVVHALVVEKNAKEVENKDFGSKCKWLSAKNDQVPKITKSYARVLTLRI